MSTTTTQTTTNPSNPTKSSYLAALQRDGYVLIPSLLRPALLEPLRHASSHLTHLARTSTWPHIRTVPKQFPPWPSVPPPPSEGGIWGVQHLLHPSCPGRSTFAEFYFCDEVLSVVKELLWLEKGEDGDEGLVMELFNLLVSPTGAKAFELRWHRDDVDISKGLSAQDEQRLLDEGSPGGRQAHAQYNVALYEDESLLVVPGSHKRARTEEERRVEPYGEDMPGVQVVSLEAGDAVFYDSNILHRGVYRALDKDGSLEGEVQRFTLHGSVGLREEKGRARARVVLQHGVGEWAGSKGFDACFEGAGSEEVERRAEAMRKRLVDMGRGEAVGFSLEG